MDPRLRFLKEKRMVESRLQLWNVIHSNKHDEHSMDPAHQWLCTEPLPHNPSSSRFSVRKRVESLLTQIPRVQVQSQRSLEQVRKPRIQSLAWEKTRADRLFQNRFLGLPGEVRNMIYDQLLVDLGVTLETPLFRSYVNGKTYHGGAQFRGAVRLPVAHRQTLCFIRTNDPVWNELFDRWCAKVRFFLFEAFEVHQTSRLHLPKLNKSKPRGTLARYLESDASQVFGSSSSWFTGMRTCTLSLGLFNIAPLLESGSRGMNALRAEMMEVARVMQHAKKTRSVHIKVRLWPRKYGDQGWKVWPTLSSGDGVLACLDPLKDIHGVERICLFAGSLMAGSWDAPDLRETSTPLKWNVVHAMPDHMESWIEASDTRL